MEIELYGFRCHNHLIFRVHPGKITLLKGQTGIGKSTILLAVQWALYGKDRNVTNNQTTGTKKMYVKLLLMIEGTPLLIYRQKNPGLIQIQYGNVIYEDKTAQDMIDNMFYDKDIWKSCCYIEQRCRNHFLNLSNAERMDLIYKLTFDAGQDPMKYIEKIDSKVRDLSSKISSDKTVFEYEKRAYMSRYEAFIPKINSVGIAAEKLLSIEYYNSLQQELGNIRTSVDGLRKLELDRSQLLGQKTQLEYMHNQKVIELTRIPSIDELDKRIESYIRKQEQKDYRDFIVHEEIISKYPNIGSIDRNKNQTSYYDMIRSNNIAKEQNIVLDSNLESKKMEMKSRRDEIRKKRDIFNGEIYKLTAMQKQYVDACNLPEELRTKEGLDLEVGKCRKKLEELNERVQIAKLCSQTITCPKCNTRLLFSTGQLKEYDGQVCTEDIHVLGKSISEYNNRLTYLMGSSGKIDIIRDFEKVKDKIPEYQGQLQNLTNELTTLEKEISLYDGLKYVEYAIEPKVLDDYYMSRDGWRRWKEKKGDENGKEEGADQKDDTVPIDTLRSWKAKRSSLETEIVDISSKLNNIVIPESYQKQISELEGKGNILLYTLSLIPEIKALEDKRYYLTKMVEDSKENENKLQRWYSLRNILIDSINASLEDIVESLNARLEEYCTMLFSVPITVRVSLYTITKTTNNVKPQISFHIHYKGAEFTSINDLSGGEGDRVSLALTLALFSFNKFPVLMMDESIFSLNEEVKEICIETLRHMVGDHRAVLNILHNDNNHLYDEVISF
ncbi:DNA double-stranded break repair ATPase [Orpheovirus IHUMI-LCC2]|uniref:DNA double-stranded break repair ATPase n=1 Tax=Orpheovirus IHUMI-LCC2 TaxID=2023057 RepID=A0A2I2L5W1_9VIRU|nr:DNA double-stranded break repair ATPase [Orpheovirus IHUMI-LCC2]SNW62917.1 DNA double-stranded break repair ATPase [Orpheovirus IHUMI-LCC2]